MKNKKVNWQAVIVVMAALLLTALMAVAVAGWVQLIRHTNQSYETPGGGLTVTENASGAGIKIAVASEAVAATSEATEAANGSATLTVSAPGYSGELVYTTSFDGEDIYWSEETHGEAEEYISITKTEINKFMLQCHSPFGQRIKITVTRTDTNESASCYCDYRERKTVDGIYIGDYEFDNAGNPKKGIRATYELSPIVLCVLSQQRLDYGQIIVSSSYTIASEEEFISDIKFRFTYNQDWLNYFWDGYDFNNSFPDLFTIGKSKRIFTHFFDMTWAKRMAESNGKTVNEFLANMYNATAKLDENDPFSLIYTDSIPAITLTLFHNDIGNWGDNLIEFASYDIYFDLTEVQQYCAENGLIT